MAVPLVDLVAQHQSLRPALDEAIARVVTTARFSGGPEVEAFEREFAEYLGAAHAVGVGSGTDALVLALEACGVGPGDEVITVSHTFFATTEAIYAVGATPVFVDIEAGGFNLDPAALEAATTPQTRAILLVHLYGAPADMGAIMAFARPRGLRVIEDCAQAHGARAAGAMVGTIGDVGCFSFYCTKNLGALGDGGCVVTNDEAIATRVRLLRDHGRADHYRHTVVGHCSRLDALQAAVLRAKLPHLDAWNTRRREVAAAYDEELRALGVEPTAVPEGDTAVYYAYTLLHPDRDHLASSLGEAGIGTAIYYPLAVHQQPALTVLDHRCGDLARTEAVVPRILSLPVYPEMTDAQVAEVRAALRKSWG